MQVKTGGTNPDGTQQYMDMGRVDRGLHVNTHGFGGFQEEGMSYKILSERTMEARKAGRLVAPRHKETPALIVIKCTRCANDFLQLRTTQRFCSVQCQKREAHKRFRQAHATGRRFRDNYPAPQPVTCKHAGEREHFAKGLCRPCYHNEWKKAKRARLAQSRAATAAPA